MPDHTIDARLAQADVFIENVLATPAIQTAFAEAGRDAGYFEAARSLLAEVRGLHQQQRLEYGEQYAATEALNAAREEASERYARHLRHARYVFKDDTRAQNVLGLKGPRRKNHAGWTAQAQTFYDQLLADPTLVAEMTAFRVTPEELQQARDALATVQARRRAQQREKGEAQQATQSRDARLAALDTLLVDNRELARLLFLEEPQTLEGLGLTIRS